ncbi:baeRF2 domain-containing protein [Actinoplanes siamensis]|uniref:baeRF2 domain-containing protein n=1 Tax=Actinoplanes siamensis TaxID=1223317 RepID=UPI001EF18D9E|nr:Vms1/Ankzf1 family peptidyl-tRNA hydrolase [Actinoplanes siamensis]
MYIDTSRETEDAAKAVELRWRGAREALAEAGCDPLTVRALQDAVLDRPARPGRHGLALFATAGEVVMRQALNAPPAENAVYDVLPHAMPMIAQMEEEIHYLRVTVDHTGGAIDSAVTGQLVRHHEIPGSADFALHKFPGGGWASLKFQHNSELTWRRNAGDVADAVTELADRTGPEIVLVAGEAKSRPMLIAQLPDRWRDRVVETDVTGRAQGALDDATVLAVAERAEAHRQDVLDRFRSQLAHGGAAGNGLSEVVTYLSRGQVDTLLMIDDPSSTEHLWIGPNPHELSDDPELLRESGIAQPALVRADAAMLRALAGTDASIMLVGPDEHDLEGGVAALLRYADARR